MDGKKKGFVTIALELENGTRIVHHSNTYKLSLDQWKSAGNELINDVDSLLGKLGYKIES